MVPKYFLSNDQPRPVFGREPKKINSCGIAPCEDGDRKEKKVGEGAEREEGKKSGEGKVFQLPSLAIFF
jgi:hypothetical protein